MSLIVKTNQPMILIPELASHKDLGITEALFLQQLHYWIGKSKNNKLGRRWVYNSMRQWSQQFPFISEKTLQRAIKKLRNLGIVKTANYNKNKYNQILWYTLDYAMLKAVTGLELYNTKHNDKGGSALNNLKARKEIKKPISMPIDNLSDSKSKITKTINTKTTYSKTPDVVSIHSVIQDTLKSNFDWKAAAKLLQEKGKEVIEKYLEHWTSFKCTTKQNVSGFFYSAVMNGWSIPTREVAELQHNNETFLSQYKEVDLDEFIFKPGMQKKLA